MTETKEHGAFYDGSKGATNPPKVKASKENVRRRDKKLKSMHKIIDVLKEKFVAIIPGCSILQQITHYVMEAHKCQTNFIFLVNV